MNPPILALHGNIGSFHDWDFLKTPEIQAINLWEHSERTLPEMPAVMEESAAPGSILLGYSMGARLALHVIAAQSDHWAGAVIISAHPGLCCVQEKIERRISDEIWAKNARTMEWSGFLEKWNTQAVLGNTTKQKKQMDLEAHREEIALGFENWTLGKQENLRSALAKFAKPVLWITGEQDKKFTRLGEEMLNVFPRFQHVIIPNCSHRVLDDAPERLAEEVARFCGRIGSD